MYVCRHITMQILCRFSKKIRTRAKTLWINCKTELPPSDDRGKKEKQVGDRLRSLGEAVIYVAVGFKNK